MSADPLIRKYKDTLQGGPHHLRGTEQPVPIKPSLLATAARDIQYYGTPYKLPAGFVPPTEGFTLPAEALRLPGTRPIRRPPGAPPPVWDPYPEELVRKYEHAPSSYLQARLLFELDILWKLYEQLVTEEFDELKAAPNTADTAYKMFISVAGKGAGHKEAQDVYRRLRPVYFRSGIAEPQRFLIKNIVSGGVRLAGRPVQQGVHKDFKTMLDRAERILRDSNFDLKVSTAGDLGIAAITYIGCFRPSDLDPLRTDKQGLRRLSNHMIGAAIDIDSGNNPHLKQAQLTVIDRILEFRVRTVPNHPPLRYTSGGTWLGMVPPGSTLKERAIELQATILEISKEVKAFLDDHWDLWRLPSTPTDPQKQEAVQLMQALADSFGGTRTSKKVTFEQTPGAKALRRIQQRGFVSISADVFVACLEAGLMSGTQYQGQKDTMHFEVPTSKQRDFIASSV